MTDDPAAPEPSDEDLPDEEVEGEDLGGLTPEHEQGYTEETAQQNKDDFGSANQDAAIEGRGVPGVS